MAETISLYHEKTPEGGILRLSKWPEGYVLWHHGKIVWRSWIVGGGTQRERANSMGADLWIRGTDSELNTRDECYLVAGWLDQFHNDKRPLDQRFGSWDYPASAVQAANLAVPANFDDALSQGFVPEDFAPNEDDREEQWSHCRAFLRAAEEAGGGITGSD